MSDFSVTPLGYALGAKVTGVDLQQPVSEGTAAKIREAILEHLVLCFPAQNIDQAALMRLAKCYGEIEPASKENTDPDAPVVTLVTNKASDGKGWSGYQAGQNWHSDHSYTTLPTSYSFLASKELPPIGGDTMFANMYMAYDTLSEKMRAIIDTLEGIHTRALPPSYRVAGNVEKQAALQHRDSVVSAERRPVAHPVARMHAETQRKGLYVGARVSQFVGMTEAESEPLIDFLNAHAVTYEFTYRHRWTLGDVLMWDNRATMHIALSDYDLDRDSRRMLRCSVVGDPSGRELTADRDAATPLAHAV